MFYKKKWNNMSAKGSELKRVRQSRKSNARNRYYKSKMTTAIKKFLSLDKKQLGFYSISL